MSGFDWRQVFPGTVVVTLVLDRDEAGEFLDLAAIQGRMVGRNVVRGMPFTTSWEDWIEENPENPQDDTPKAGDGPKPQEPVENGHPLRPDNDAGGDGTDCRYTTRPDGGCGNTGEPDPKIAILPVVRREPFPIDRSQGGDAATPPLRPRSQAVEPRFSARSPLSETPPVRHAPPREPEVRYLPGKGPVRRGTITEEDKRLAAEAIAAGRVTKLPPGHARGDYAFNGFGEVIGHQETENRAKTALREKSTKLRAARQNKGE